MAYTQFVPHDYDSPSKNHQERALVVNRLNSLLMAAQDLDYRKLDRLTEEQLDAAYHVIEEAAALVQGMRPKIKDLSGRVRHLQGGREPE